LAPARFAIALEGPVTRHSMAEVVKSVPSRAVLDYKAMELQQAKEIRAARFLVSPQDREPRRVESIAAALADGCLQHASKRVHYIRMADIGPDPAGDRDGDLDGDQSEAAGCEWMSGVTGSLN
jgi:hypothetical protein